MKPIKTSPNVEFDVIYADGTRCHVAEGILFEADGKKMRGHFGTGRPEVLFAVAECLCEIIDALGLGPMFKEYTESAPIFQKEISEADKRRPQ